MEIKEIVITKKKLTAENLFSYCPYCKSNFIPTGTITYKESLPKLIYLKRLLKWTAADGEHKAWDEVYYCERCGKKDITDADFIQFYGLNADGTKKSTGGEK